MGKTMVIYKISPSDMEKLEETKEQIRNISSGKVADIKEEPIGFGVTILKVGVIIPEKVDGAMEKVSKELSELSLVENAEQEGMTLL